jgi:undecaprenyl diphosphate synthase
LRLCLALNYGARDEIVHAVRSIAVDIREGKIAVEDIDDSVVSSALYTSGLPDPDLLIRTANEQRISNFLLWQISYSEIYITDRLWPEFTVDDLNQAIVEFARRERRYGDLAPADAE